jgi:hypothetical protein
MKQLLKLKNLLAIAIIVVAFWPKPSQDVVLLNIEKPTQQVIELVKPLSDLVADPTDRAKLAIFNQEFAERVSGYNTDTQQVNDVYVLSASYFFKDALVDKYRDLDKMIIGLIEHTTSSDNHVLSQEEKNKLSESFMGLAWSLIQKR